MKKIRLDERVQRLRSILANIVEVLDEFSTPAFDEDYKVEAHLHLTDEAFDRVEQFANELDDQVEWHFKKFDSQQPPESEGPVMVPGPGVAVSPIVNGPMVTSSSRQCRT